MRLLTNLLICAGASAVVSILLLCVPADGQYSDDSYKDRYFKPIEFEKVHRGAVNVYNSSGMFNISQCSIDLMICLEDAPNDMVCSRSRPLSFLAYLDTVCPLLRERCHDYIPTFQGPLLDFQEGPCHEEYAAEDIDYG